MALTAMSALVIWFLSILFGFEDKRLYATIGVALAFLLKLLLIDLGSPSPFQYEDGKIQQGLLTMFNRFLGALRFLEKTSVSRHGKSLRLNTLPWYLLIGPVQAGKTSLLANSHVNFVLQRHTPSQHDNCDWWVTRDASIIDVPGKYTCAIAGQQSSGYGVLWTFFLRLIKKYRGNTGLNGLIIALPLPETMQSESKSFEHMLQGLCLRISEIQEHFAYPLPCQIVITQCDKLAGFNDYFIDLADDETTQAWGLQLTDLEPHEKINEAFTERFNTLIKRLNQQLISRLHHERNSSARPSIKDFPLELERLKENAAEVIKTLCAPNLNLSVQGVYLTSALQTAPESPELALEGQSTTSQTAILFKKPYAASRAYFIKQFITHAITSLRPEPVAAPAVWKRRLAYSLSILVIGLTAFVLGKDFERGIKKTYAMQSDITNYQLAIRQFNDPEEHLAKTVSLLDTLQQSVEKTQFKFDLPHLLSFYSFKSQEKASQAYQQALRVILLPEVKTYLENFLKQPANRVNDSTYAVLKSYLMLSDAAQLQPQFIANTIQNITPNFINTSEAEKLAMHLKEAYANHPQAIMLDAELIQKSRAYLTAMSPLQLSFILLKNLNNNSKKVMIDLGVNGAANGTFATRNVNNQISTMYTGTAFPHVISKDIPVAAHEALSGNWVLGNIDSTNKSLVDMTTLEQQLQTDYITKYASVWDAMLTNIYLTTPSDLTQVDSIISHLIGSHSPLVHLLQTVHSNTDFEQITAISNKLQSLNLLISKSSPDQGLMIQVVASLQSLHQYLRPVISANNQHKAAFELLTARMKQSGTADPITHVRLLADKTPEPVKSWLNKLTDDTYRLMMESSGSYLNTAWQSQVYDYYQREIANRYPFVADADSDVALQKFTDFFGNPGILASFYHQYLQNFVDTTKNDWQWKPMIDGKSIFADAALHQIQQAMRIQRTFFPNGDNKLYVRFALQPYQLSKQIASVQLKINDKKLSDENSKGNPHVLMWPSASNVQMTSIQAVLVNNKTISREFPGDWGWFKLVNQSLDNSINKHQAVLDFSTNGIPAKYLFFTEGQYNAFLTPNLKNFGLPKQLIGKDKLNA